MCCSIRAGRWKTSSISRAAASAPLPREVYRNYVGRTLDASVYTTRTPRLPGLDLDARGGNILRESGVDGGAERFRGIVEGGL